MITGVRHAVVKEVRAVMVRLQTDVVSFFTFAQPSTSFIGAFKSPPGGKAGSVAQVFSTLMMDAAFAKPVSIPIEYSPIDDAKQEMSFANKARVLRLNMFLTHEQNRRLQNNVSPVISAGVFGFRNADFSSRISEKVNKQFRFLQDI